MANEIVLRSAVLDDAVKSVSTFNANRRRLGRSSLSEMGGLSFGSGKASHQFMVVDSSVYADDGMLAQPKVSVVNGHSPDDATAGTLNKVSYAKTELTLATTEPTFYVYAIHGQIYALKHIFQSDFFAVLLLATVTIADGKVTIRQQNYTDNPTVAVCGAEHGVITLTGSLELAGHDLTATYTVAAKVMKNYVPIEMSATQIPTADTGRLFAYVQNLVVDNHTEAVTGFAFNGAIPAGATWTQNIFSYTLDATSFTVEYRAESPYLFTFTEMLTNADEVTV